jgi:FKBP-type peptidyl-prolyl cis-trans isomerase
MRRLFLLVTFAALIISFSACNKNESLDDWREENMNAYQAITKNPYYKELKTTNGPAGVYYKVIKSGTGTEYPIQTSKVKVLYKGSYYDGTVFDVGSSQNDVPVEFLTQNTVRGFSFALQQMVVGDKWEIWIPYYLGYGTSGSYDYYTGQVGMKGYTTLVFELELVGITQYP